MKIFIPPLKIFASLLLLIFSLHVSATVESSFMRNVNGIRDNNAPRPGNDFNDSYKSLSVVLPPVANLDTISLTADSTTYINVLSNDFDPGGNPFNLDSIVKSPSYGTASIAGSLIAYHPAATQCGLVDTLIYRIRNSNNETDTAKVIIHIIGVSPPLITANTPLCIGSILQLTTNGYNEGDYVWQGPLGFTSDVQNPVIGNVSLGNSGTYSLYINSGSCISDTVYIDVVVLPLPTVSLPVDTTLCEGDSLLLDAGAGYNYTWSNGVTTQTQIVDSTGTYTVTVSNLCGVATDNITVNVLIPPHPDLGPDSSLCVGSSITLNANTNGQTYLWSDGSSLPSLTVDSSGTYWVIATNQCGSDTDSVVVIVTVPLPPISIGSDTLLCNGDSALLNAGAGAGLTYLWSNGFTTQTVYVSAPGTYIVTVTNACGNKTDTINLTTSVTPVINLGADTALCIGTTVTLSGPGNATSYQWSSGDTTQSITVDTLGTYWVVATNQCGSDTDSVSFNVFDQPPVVNLGNDTLLCNGILISLGADSGYAYQWSDGSTTQVISAGTQGTYTVTVSNTCGSASDDITINTEVTPVINLGADTSLCAGVSFIFITPSNSTYWSWSDGSSSQSFIVDALGTYWLIAGNICGSDTDSISFNMFVQQPVVILANDTLLCNGASVTLDAGSGYAYTWSDGSTDQVITAGTQGTYTVTVTNVCGSATDSATIATEATPLVNLGSDTVLCNAGTTTLSAPGNATSYLWSDGSTLQNLAVNTLGTFWLIAGNVCGSDTDSITFNSFVVQPVINLGNDTLICAGDSILLDAGAGYLYLWNDGTTNQTIAGMQGTYIVTVTNVCGSAVDSITLNVNTAPVVNLGNDTYLCENATITLTGPAGATSYLWNDGSTLQTLLVDTIGYYWLTATNICGSTIDTIYITPLIILPTVNIGNDILLCNGGSVLLTADSGYTYIWSDGTTNQTLLASTQGTYIVTVDNGCATARDTLIITTGVTPVINFGNDTSLCAGTSLTLTAPVNATLYLWNNDSTYQSLLADTAGTYWLIATNLCGSDTDSITINAIIPLATVNLGNDTAFCAGDSINLDAGAGYTYQWSNGSSNQTIDVGVAGTYTVTVTNVCGSATDVIQISSDVAPVVTLPNDTSICIGDSISLDAGGGYVYQWSTGSSNQMIAISAAGAYTVTVTNACGSATDVIQLSTDSIPVVNLSNDTTLCTGASLTFTASGNATSYQWSDGSTLSSITVDTLGTWWVDVANKCGAASDTVSITAIYQSPVVDLGNDTSFCSGEFIHLNAGLFASYLWQDGSVNDSYHITQQGTYWVQVTDSNGCKDTDTLSIVNVYSLPAAFLPPDTLICIGTLFTINSLNNFNAYTWSNGSTANQLTVTDTGYYWLIVTDQNGCVGADSIYLGSDCDKDSTIFFPNVFTPNDDAQNNTWYATGKVATFEIVIFDRWGVKMFDANSITNEWDGKYHDANCPDGVYYYIAKYRVKMNDFIKRKTGFITLLR